MEDFADTSITRHALIPQMIGEVSVTLFLVAPGIVLERVSLDTFVFIVGVLVDNILDGFCCRFRGEHGLFYHRLG